MVTDNSM